MAPHRGIAVPFGVCSLVIAGRELEVTGCFVLAKKKRAGNRGELYGAKEHEWRASGGADRFDMNVA